ncbi:MAG: hypothetical protein KDJ38_07820 [Gammaproteobacteria bacterium]|nr:hypothetical protein [Gammaproteobacteria bacterium]
MTVLSVFWQNLSRACRRLLALCATLALLSACDTPSDDTTNGHAPIPLPQAMQRASFPSGGSVTASITIDPQNGGTAQAMTVSNSGLSFSGRVDDGEHEFLLELFYSSSSVERLRLVSASKTVIVDGATDIQFRERDYEYENTDDDFYTNVREIEAGSDPRVTSSTPSDRDDNYEDNDSHGTAYDITGLRDILIYSGISTSYGVITAEDSSDYFKMTLDENFSVFDVELFLDPSLDVNLEYLDSNGGNPTIIGEPVNVEVLENDVLHGTVRVTNAQARDYYLNVFATEDDIEGTYALRWTAVK